MRARGHACIPSAPSAPLCHVRCECRILHAYVRCSYASSFTHAALANEVVFLCRTYTAECVFIAGAAPRRTWMHHLALCTVPIRPALACMRRGASVVLVLRASCSSSSVSSSSSSSSFSSSSSSSASCYSSSPAPASASCYSSSASASPSCYSSPSSSSSSSSFVIIVGLAAPRGHSVGLRFSCRVDAYVARATRWRHASERGEGGEGGGGEGGGERRGEEEREGPQCRRTRCAACSASRALLGLGRPPAGTAYVAVVAPSKERARDWRGAWRGCKGLERRARSRLFQRT